MMSLLSFSVDVIKKHDDPGELLYGKYQAMRGDGNPKMPDDVSGYFHVFVFYQRSFFSASSAMILIASSSI